MAFWTLFFFGAIGLFVGGWYGVQMQQNKLYETRTTISRLEAEKRDLESLTKLAAETEGARNTLKTRIVANSDVIGFLAKLESLARRHNAEPTTQSIETAPDADPDRFELLRISLNLKGSEKDVQEVITHIEAMPYQLSLERVTLRNDVEDTGTSSVADILLVVTKTKS
jgi:hypothetical protein